MKRLHDQAAPMNSAPKINTTFEEQKSFGRAARSIMRESHDGAKRIKSVFVKSPMFTCR